MIQAVLFDIGGTLHTQTPSPACDAAFAGHLWSFLQAHGLRTADTPQALLKAVDAGAAAYKRHVEQTLKELDGTAVWTDFFLKAFNLPAARIAPIAEDLSLMFDAQRKIVEPRAGLLDMLTTLKERGIRMGVISNMISTRFVPDVLEKYGITSFFETVVLSCVCGIRKPDPKIFDLALSEMGIPKAAACYVGDTISRDVLGVRRAGWGWVIQIDNPLVYHRDAAVMQEQAVQPDFSIQSLPEIVPIIDRINCSEN